jgi:predicted NAD/FAD-dependent oxidoreductase
MAGRIGIVGAGLCGLAAAADLVAAGREVAVFDKSRGIGGRLATRRVDAMSFDHGAPCANGDAAFLDWLGTLGAEVRDGAGRGRPGMSALLKPLAQRLDLEGGAEVAAIRPASRGWTLTATDGAALGAYDAVILAIPAPQVRRLLPPDVPGAEALDVVRMAPGWALLAGFEAPLDLPDALPPSGDIARAARQGPGDEAWVVHFTSAFTRDTLETEKDAILPDLMARFAALAGPLPPTTYAAAHRWRHARTEVALGAPFVGDPDAGLLIGGDWTLGPDAGHAWASGRAMARALLSAGAESR